MKIDFSTFLMSLASSAYCSLGLTPNPMTQKTERNLESAKQQIDLLELLKEKTKGNLSKEEETLVDSILYQLHISYVQISGSKQDAKQEASCSCGSSCECSDGDCGDPNCES